MRPSTLGGQKRTASESIHANRDCSICQHVYHPVYPNESVLDHHLSMLAYLVAKTPEKTRFLLLDVGPLKGILDALDPALASRVTWIGQNQVAQIEGRLTVSFHPSGAFGPHPRYGANVQLRSWLNSLEGKPFDEEVVIYYARVKPQAKLGRIMDSGKP